MAINLGPPDQPEDVDIIDDESGEVLSTVKRAPRVRSLDQIIARANGGKYAEQMPKLLEAFVASLYSYSQENDIVAKGRLSVDLITEVDRFGEMLIEIKPKVKLPDPPSDDGKARFYVDPDGVLRTHKQQEMPLFRDASKPSPTMRDTHAPKGS